MSLASDMRRIILLVLLALSAVATSCGNSVQPVDGAAPSVACGVATCASGQQCCLLTGACYDPVGAPASCSAANPPTDAGTPAGTSLAGTGRIWCASAADCHSNEYCWSPLCVGIGRCVERPAASLCVGGSSPVCGCDGTTYTTECAAHLAGVRVSVPAACGTPYSFGRYGMPSPTRPRTGCGTNGTCPSGQTCCAITGVCNPSNCTFCCSPPADGASYPCDDNSACVEGQYCQGDGCAGPAICVPQRTSCGVDEHPVCGCDRVTYLNPCGADMAGSRVEHAGGCASADGG